MLPENEMLEKLSKFVVVYSNISLEHTKQLNKHIDIMTMLKDRIIALEKQAQDFEVDIRVVYSKVKDLEREEK